jgi:hypothetical protein
MSGHVIIRDPCLVAMKGATLEAVAELKLLLSETGAVALKATTEGCPRYCTRYAESTGSGISTDHHGHERGFHEPTAKGVDPWRVHGHEEHPDLAEEEEQEDQWEDPSRPEWDDWTRYLTSQDLLGEYRTKRIWLVQRQH